MKRKVQAEKKKNCDCIGFDGCCEIIDDNLQKKTKKKQKPTRNKKQGQRKNKEEAAAHKVYKANQQINEINLKLSTDNQHKQNTAEYRRGR